MKIKFIRFGDLGSHPQLYVQKPKLYHSAPAKKGFYAAPFSYRFDQSLLGSTLSPWNSSGKSAWLMDKDGKYLDFKNLPDELLLPENVVAALKYNKISKKNICFHYMRNPLYCYCNKKLKISNIKIAQYKICPLRETTWEYYNEKYSRYPFLKNNKEKWKNRIQEQLLLDYNIIKQADQCEDNSFYRAFYLKSPKIFEYTGEIWHHLEHYAPLQLPVIKRYGSWIKTDFETYCKIFEMMLHQVKSIALEFVKEYHNEFGYDPTLEQMPSHILMRVIKQSLLKKGSYMGFGSDELEVFIEKV